MYLYEKATVIRIIDGDTAVLRVDCGFRMTYEGPFRLLGLDAPEITGPEKPEGLKWKAALEQLIPVGTVLEAQTLKPDSFGRWLVVLTKDGHSVSQVLIDLMAQPAVEGT
jgi:endonuclease YncB( thermonuclease family)